MADNVNIIVQDTINDIVVNAAVVVETIDINVQAAVDVVDIVANPNNYVVNINRIIGEQVQSDWTQTDNQAPDYIKNKPTIPAAQVNSDWDATSGVAEILNKPIIPTATSDLTNDGEDGVNPFITAADVPASVTSVGLTMPSAFSVANSPITSAGTLEVTGAGLVSQYVRGDGSLANFPTSTGGGSSLAFYLNGSVSQGTFGGVAFKEMDRTPILGAGTDFTISSNGYIQSFITDANVPNLLEIPAGNWNFETYFSASSGGGSPSFYLELYKWNGTTLSLIASNSANPEGITNGTAIDLYVSALAVPQTTLLATDRLAVRIYVTPAGRTIKLHTEDNHLCQVITTFSTGITALNGLTTQVQSFATGTSGTDFAISSATATHTFNLPTASAANRGALSSTDWNTFNNKQGELFDFYTKRGFLFWEDFLGDSLNSTTEGWGVSTRITAGAGTITSNNTFPNRTYQQGVVAMSSNANAASQCVIRVGAFNNAAGTFFGNGKVIFETYLNVETLSTATDRFLLHVGYSSSIAILTTTCYQFVYDEGGLSTNGGAASPNWKCCTFNGTTRVNTNTGIAVTASAWYKLRIEVNATNTGVDFYINNTLVASHTTGIGMSGLSPKMVFTKAVGTTNRNIYVDYIGMTQTFTNQR